MERDEAKLKIKDLVEEAAKLAMEHRVNFLVLTDKHDDDETIACMTMSTVGFLLGCRDVMENEIKDAIAEAKEALDKKPIAEA